jgi:type IV pilus assembly protein PilF
MRILVVVLLLIAAAGCASQSSVETRPVTDVGGADARRRAEVHTGLAGEYYSRGNLAVAIAETRLALKDDSTYYQAYNMQALIYMELREDVLARESFDAALRLSPNNPELLNNFGCSCACAAKQRSLDMICARPTTHSIPPERRGFPQACACAGSAQPRSRGRVRRAVLIRPDLIRASTTWRSSPTSAAPPRTPRFTSTATPRGRARSMRWCSG